MSQDAVDAIKALTKALEEGGYTVSPSTLKQGCVFEFPTEWAEAFEAWRAANQRLHEMNAKHYPGIPCHCGNCHG